MACLTSVPIAAAGPAPHAMTDRTGVLRAMKID
jgi:hypothetical protein